MVSEHAMRKSRYTTTTVATASRFRLQNESGGGFLLHFRAGSMAATETAAACSNLLKAKEGAINYPHKGSTSVKVLLLQSHCPNASNSPFLPSFLMRRTMKGDNRRRSEEPGLNSFPLPPRRLSRRRRIPRNDDDPVLILCSLGQASIVLLSSLSILQLPPFFLPLSSQQQ